MENDSINNDIADNSHVNSKHISYLEHSEEVIVPVSAKVPDSKLLNGELLNGELPKPLSRNQQRIWNMHLKGMMLIDIAKELGFTQQYIRNTMVVIRRKLGVSVTRTCDNAIKSNLTENRKPEKAAAIMDALSEPDPYISIAESLRNAGLPDAVGSGVVRRLRVRYNGEISELRNLKSKELLDLLNKKIHLALTYMDDQVMASANFRDLAMGITQMVEKHQLLKGEPTQIISDNERKKLHELLPALVAEAQRRGVTLEGKVIEKIIEA